MAKKRVAVNCDERVKVSITHGKTPDGGHFMLVLETKSAKEFAKDLKILAEYVKLLPNDATFEILCL